MRADRCSVATKPGRPPRRPAERDHLPMMQLGAPEEIVFTLSDQIFALPLVMATLIASGVGWMLGFILLAGGLWRARTLPRWVPIGMLAAVLIQIGAGGSRLLQLSGAFILLPPWPSPGGPSCSGPGQRPVFAMPQHCPSTDFGPVRAQPWTFRRAGPCAHETESARPWTSSRSTSTDVPGPEAIGADVASGSQAQAQPRGSFTSFCRCYRCSLSRVSWPAEAHKFSGP